MNATLASISRMERIEAIEDALRRPTNPLDVIVVVSGVVALIILLLILGRVFRDGSKPQEKRPDLLGDLMHLADLPKADREMLRGVATRARLTAPASIMLSPANLARAVEAVMSEGDDPVLRRRANAIAFRLFGRALPGGRADRS